MRFRSRAESVVDLDRREQDPAPHHSRRGRRADPGAERTACTKDALGTAGHETHPATGTPLVGETLPEWDRVLDLARTCAPIFAPLRYQSMDIAITPEGPLLVEINTGGAFNLPQLASGRGFLTDPVREFFRDCGYPKV